MCSQQLFSHPEGKHGHLSSPPIFVTLKRMDGAPPGMTSGDREIDNDVSAFRIFLALRGIRIL